MLSVAAVVEQIIAYLSYFVQCVWGNNELTRTEMEQSYVPYWVHKVVSFWATWHLLSRSRSSLTFIDSGGYLLCAKGHSIAHILSYKLTWGSLSFYASVGADWLPYVLYHINSRKINECKAVEYVLYNMRNRKVFQYVGSEMQENSSSADCFVCDDTNIRIWKYFLWFHIVFVVLKINVVTSCIL